MPFLLAISVGNTRTAVGHFHGDELHVVQHLANGDVGAIVAAACEQWEHKGDEDGEVVIASVNDPVATAVEARLATVAERKAKLAEALLGDIEKLRKQLWAPTVERKPMVVSDGKDLGSHIEIAEVIYDRPPTADQKRIVEAVAILVDKIQLLTGDATARIEQTDGAAAQPKRAQLVTVVDQLAERRNSA